MFQKGIFLNSIENTSPNNNIPENLESVLKSWINKVWLYINVSFLDLKCSIKTSLSMFWATLGSPLHATFTHTMKAFKCVLEIESGTYVKAKQQTQGSEEALKAWKPWKYTVQKTIWQSGPGSPVLSESIMLLWTRQWQSSFHNDWVV